jgi:hypothetical protein
MANTSEQFTAEQSLDLISGMIRQAKGNVSYNSKYFLLWGWCIALADLGMYALMRFTEYPRPYLVWLISIPAIIVTIIFAMQEKRETATATVVERMIMWLWVVFFFILGPVIAFGFKINYQINPLILLMTAFPTAVTGIVLRFRPLIFGGIGFWIFSLLAFVVDAQTQPLIGALAMVLGYLVPGYMLKQQRLHV